VVFLRLCRGPVRKFWWSYQSRALHPAPRQGFRPRLEAFHVRPSPTSSQVRQQRLTSPRGPSVHDGLLDLTPAVAAAINPFNAVPPCLWRLVPRLDRPRVRPSPASKATGSSSERDKTRLDPHRWRAAPPTTARLENHAPIPRSLPDSWLPARNQSRTEWWSSISTSTIQRRYGDRTPTHGNPGFSDRMRARGMSTDGRARRPRRCGCGRLSFAA